MDENSWKLVFLVLFLIWFLVRTYFVKKSLKTKIKTKKNADSEWFLVFLNSISMILLPLIVVFSTGLDFANMSLPEYFRWTGAVIYGLNLILFLWCHKSLGKNWSSVLEIRENHELVKSGPYGWVRHPMYTHFWILIISQGVVLSNWIVLGCGVLTWGLLYLLRVKKEEKMMLEEFGSEYQEYMEKTGKLFPKINRLINQKNNH